MTWWLHDARVNVQIGQAEHAGRVRITPGALYKLRGASGKHTEKGTPNPPNLRLADFPGMPAEPLGPVAVNWEMVGDALIVTMPWSDARGASKVPALAPLQATDPPKLAATPTSPLLPPVRVPKLPIALKTGEEAVLRLLHSFGDRVGLDLLTHSNVRMLRQCEGRELAQWDNYRKKWSLTDRGLAAIGQTVAA